MLVFRVFRFGVASLRVAVVVRCLRIVFHRHLVVVMFVMMCPSVPVVHLTQGHMESFSVVIIPRCVDLVCMTSLVPVLQVLFFQPQVLHSLSVFFIDYISTVLIKNSHVRFNKIAT